MIFRLDVQLLSLKQTTTDMRKIQRKDDNCDEDETKKITANKMHTKTKRINEFE